MPTSLAEQLQKLAVPQSSSYEKDKKKPSLLFDPKVAALKDRETFHEIGLSGLRELIVLSCHFSQFEDTLFSLSSKDYERAVQTKEANKKLDEHISEFLARLSPYFLLQSSHKSLEWLINRFHIEEYNQDDVMRLILPYHETKIFVRCLQLLKINNVNNKWNWLEPLQKSGIPLAKSVLFNHAKTNLWFLKFISKMATKAIKICGDTAKSLTTLFAFYCTTSIGMLHSSRRISEGHVSAIIPTLMKALSSGIEDFKACGIMILAQLISKTQLKATTLERLMKKLIMSEPEISYDTTLLMQLMYDSQKSLSYVSEEILNDISSEQMEKLTKILNQLLLRDTDVSTFVKCLLKGILQLLQSGIENFIRFKDLPDIIISNVDFNDKQAEHVIECILSTYTASEQKSPEDSDIEVIEFVQSRSSADNWYSMFLKRVNVKYPTVTDAIVKRLVRDDDARYNKLKSVLFFQHSVAHNFGHSDLFTELYHYNSVNRIEALNYVVKEFERLSTEETDLIFNTIFERLEDDDPDVVMAVLKLPQEQMLSVINNDISKGKKSLQRILDMAYHHPLAWNEVTKKVVKLLCSLDFDFDVDILLTLLPYLFPDNNDSLEITLEILKSKFAAKCSLLKMCAKLLRLIDTSDREIVAENIFSVIESKLWVSLMQKSLNNYQMTNHSCTNIISYLILKSNLLQDNITPSDSLVIFNEILQLIRKTNLFVLENGNSSNSSNIIDCFSSSRQGIMPLQVVAYILKELISNTKFTYSGNDWFVVDNTTDEIKLITKLFDTLITGCGHKTQGNIYAVLMTMFINKLCVDVKSKMILLTNFSVGHIVQKSDIYSIAPELQLRSLRLLRSLISKIDTAATIFDLNIILAILIALNCPLSPIRSEALSIVKIFLEKEGAREHCYFYLLQELFERSEELSLDHEQLPLILYTLLSQDVSVKGGFKKNIQIQLKKCLLVFIDSLQSAPLHIVAAILSLLVHINSPEILTSILSVNSNILTKIKNKSKTPTVYEYRVLKFVINRIDINTLQNISEDNDIWKMIQQILQQYEPIFSSENGNQLSACSIFLKQFDEDCFYNLPPLLSKRFIQMVCEVGTIGNNTTAVSSASKFIRKVNLTSNHFNDIFQTMIDVQELTTQTIKRKIKTPLIPSLAIIDSKEWRCGVTLLEYVQNKKKLLVNPTDIQILFKILKKCLDFEEQSALEYVKQLLLSCILHWCQKCIQPIEKVDVSESIFDTELIVKCIRGTQNPQTHHHALILLAYLANIFPNQVLHHTMAVFTFIGSSVLRHDDAYSFQIISRIIETVIPVLTKFNGNIDDRTEEILKKDQKVVIPVLRIFVDAVLDVPEHRRLPLYTKLIETLGAPYFLWIFSTLLFEAHVVHDKEESGPKESNRTLANKEKPVNRIEFAISLFCEFSYDIILQNMVHLIDYLQNLPLEKKEENSTSEINAAEMFSISAHTSKRLRHFKYTIVTFLDSLISSTSFQHQISGVSDQSELEMNYKLIIIKVLTFIQFVSKTADQNTLKPQGKYWKVMLHHSYELLESVNNLLSPQMFVTVIGGLMTHNLMTVRRKSMEILNSKLQHAPEFFANCDNSLMYSLLTPLIKILQGIKSNKSTTDKYQELQYNQQTALLSLKLLTRQLCNTDPAPFKAVLVTITDLVRCEDIDRNVMASIVLCLAELCSNLKAHAISNLPKYMPSLIKILKQQRKVQAPELILLSVITALHKIVESLPLFLSPYLEKILFELSILHAKWKKSTYDSTKVSPVVAKLSSVINKIATTISPRILIPIVNRSYEQLISKESYDAIGPLMMLLADSFSATSGAELTSLMQEITSFFLVSLQLRSNYADTISNKNQVYAAEEEVVKALVALILKLSETSFRPFYFKIYDWAFRSNVENRKERAITFYRLSNAIAESLKGLFVLFAGHFIKNAAELLDQCNATKSDTLYFESEEKCCLLVEYILKTLFTVFLYDGQNFINKEKFETLMQSIVDQLENDINGLESLKIRAKDMVIPCIAQFAVATADDSLWKPLNYQILLKTRHNESEIRLLAVDCLVTTAKRLGQGWLPLLAESVPFLSELMEDGDVKVDEAAKDAVRELEQVLGEPLQKYF